MTLTDRQQQNPRRELLCTEVRKGICDYVNPDGTGKVVQLTPPYREMLWILPALFTGSQNTSIWRTTWQPDSIPT